MHFVPWGFLKYLPIHQICNNVIEIWGFDRHCCPLSKGLKFVLVCIGLFQLTHLDPLTLHIVQRWNKIWRTSPTPQYGSLGRSSRKQVCQNSPTSVSDRSLEIYDLIITITSTWYASLRTIVHVSWVKVFISIGGWAYFYWDFVASSVEQRNTLKNFAKYNLFAEQRPNPTFQPTWWAVLWQSQHRVLTARWMQVHWALRGLKTKHYISSFLLPYLQPDIFTCEII